MTVEMGHVIKPRKQVTYKTVYVNKHLYKMSKK